VTNDLTLRLWDGSTDRGVVRLAWSGDEIVSVESADGEGDDALSIVPGLVDTHVHLGYNASQLAFDPTTWPIITPPEERSLHIAANAISCLRGGVTTVRDLAADAVQMAVERAFDQGVLEGPRLRTHGMVGMTAGHGDLFVPPRYRVRDAVADSPDECRKVVRTWAREGADGVKIYTSGGVLSMGDKVGWRNQTLDEIRATIDEAHALGMPVAAHTHTANGVDIALAEGVDSIEHGTGIEERHFATLLERNIPVAPTLLINDIIAEARRPVTAEAQEKAKDVVALRDRNFAAAGAAGIRFVLGTDASSQFVAFGDQMEEVRAMAATFSWSPERAMVAATSDAADAIGLGNTVGTLAPGFGADFLIVRGRPWEDISALDTANIVAVVSRGRLAAGSLPA